MTKKLLLGLVSIVLGAALAGCAGGSDDESTRGTTDTTDGSDSDIYNGDAAPSPADGAAGDANQTADAGTTDGAANATATLS